MKACRELAAQIIQLRGAHGAAVCRVGSEMGERLKTKVLRLAPAGGDAAFVPQEPRTGKKKTPGDPKRVGNAAACDVRLSFDCSATNAA